jgi:hypothetical protein
VEKLDRKEKKNWQLKNDRKIESKEKKLKNG